jgi:hypothetical protein
VSFGWISCTRLEFAESGNPDFVISNENMGHHITGLIASQTTLAGLDAPFAKQPRFALAEGLGFLPLDYENLDDVVGHYAGGAVGKFENLTPKLIALLEKTSESCVLAYVETEYFGGTGGQSAVVFRQGKIVFGPTSAEGGVINEALGLLGVQASPDHFDAFESVGLQRHRSNEDWREAAESA